MEHPNTHPVELLYRPAAPLRMRPNTRGNYRQTCNVTYAEAYGVGLIMDVFTPVVPANGLGVIDVVSGAWHADRTLLNEHIGLGVIDALCERGFVVFAMSPGSIVLFNGLEQTRHVHAAIRHIKTHAAAYGVDAARLGIMGASAGGHLASLTALTPRPSRPEARDIVRRQATNVAGVAVFFPPSDLLDYKGQRFDRVKIEGLDLTRLLFSEGIADKTDQEIEQRLTALSPARLVNAQPPPFMIIQGKADPMVPWEQAEKLADALRRSGGQVRLVYKEQGGHVWPGIDVEAAAAAAWLEATLSAT